MCGNEPPYLPDGSGCGPNFFTEYDTCKLCQNKRTEWFVPRGTYAIDQRVSKCGVQPCYDRGVICTPPPAEGSLPPCANCCKSEYQYDEGGFDYDGTYKYACR
jgi:hypothetical protein